ncbi:MAG: serine--tRNA ligase [Flavobacteriales bacterium]|nr:serine--tRNA ligase [Flavobacteriales bacterium]
MIELTYLRENKEEAIDRLSRRGFDSRALIEDILKKDKERRTMQAELDQSLAKMNKLSKEIGALFKSGKADEANILKSETAALKEANKDLGDQLQEVADSLSGLLYDLPNAPHLTVPKGHTEDDNEIVFESGKKPNFDFQALPHWDLADKYDIIDFELGNKITGAGFPVYKGKGARLQRSLINFFLDQAIAAGYAEVQPPHLVNEASGIGTGQLPDKEGQMYHVTEDHLYLIPTAEVPITNIYRDVIVNKTDFPIKNVGYTPCFRREAGSYGKDVRGLNRLHQFDKVEIVQITNPENSYQVLDEMVEYVKGLLNQLGLPYRVAKLCGGDLGFASAMTYDMEVYSAAQDKWLEVSSVSNFESFQSNRLKLRYKDDGKTVLAHTLNGSALALPRILAALLENNQDENGVNIPECLQSYTGFSKIE